MIEPIELTEDIIKICHSANIPILDDNDRFVLIHRYNPREAERVKQQILDDYKKARTFDDALENGLIFGDKEWVISQTKQSKKFREELQKLREGKK